MENGDKIYFLPEINNLAAMYGKELSASVLNLYWDTLREYELSDVKKAIRAHVADIKAGKYMPKVADLIAFLPAKRNSGTAQNVNSNPEFRATYLKYYGPSTRERSEQNIKKFIQTAQEMKITTRELYQRMCLQDKKFAAFAKLAGMVK